MRSPKTVIACLMSLGALAFAAPQISQAQTEVVDFSGVMAQSNITFGTLVPLGYQLPGTFTGSFLYDPTATGLTMITDVVVNLGSGANALQIAQGPAGGGHIIDGVVGYSNSTFPGLTGDLPGLGINGFYMSFADPTNGQIPTEPGSINFNDFSSKTIEFDLGDVQASGEVHGVGSITIVKVPEPGPLPLLVALFCVPLVLRLKFGKRSAEAQVYSTALHHL